MSAEANKATLRRVFDEVLIKGDMSIVPELISPDYVQESMLGVYKGHEGFKEFMTNLREALPDVWVNIDEMIAEGETVAARFTFGGTFTGMLGEYKPTGKAINLTCAYFYHYKDGKEIGAIPFVDSLQMAQQFGIETSGG